MPDTLTEVAITKLVEGGQGLGVLPDGKKVFVWNALPGETVRVRLIKQKRSYAEAVAEEIITPSPERVDPVRWYFLSTAPWQILTYKAENKYKKQLVGDIFRQAKLKIPKFELVSVPDPDIWTPPDGRNLESVLGVYHYRNKMEYNFWGDDEGIHLAAHFRGTHGKQIITRSSLAMPGIDEAGNRLCEQLTGLGMRAGDLKTIIIRCSQAGDVVASLFVKRETFPELSLTPELNGLRVYFSNPKSPASVRTKLLYEVGNVLLTDTLLDKSFVYDADSFFQVNVPIYERALARIKEWGQVDALVDMYAGVGTIGLSMAAKSVELIELDSATAHMAGQNAAASGLDASVIEASTEKALEYITGDKLVIFDPPRAGLHDKVASRVLDVRPPRVVYLSCNPVTQARDLQKLCAAYDITYFEAYNFFPRTPHIETLAVLDRK